MISMDTGQRIAWVLKWCSLFASVTFLSTINSHAANTCGGNEQNSNRFLMIVSTLDGRVTALEVGSGQEEWSITAGERPLLSSSITNLEMGKDGAPIRLIPSLDGGLYQYDGSGIEPVPLAADVLLSNSFRFGDDSTVVGGKQVDTYGVDINTGKYICTIDGCKYFSSNSSEAADDSVLGDTLVITRQTKTVRAVKMQSGAEKWNFSVGTHELSYIKSSLSGDSGHRYPRDHLVEGKGTTETEHCSVEDEEEGFFDGFNFHWFSTEEAGNSEMKYSPDDLHIKVIVPSGIVIAVLKENPAQIVWQQKFDVAIADAWLLKGDELSQVNLFDNENIPALSMGLSDTIPDGEEDNEDDDKDSSAMLYIGVYENQVYVQPSYRLMQEVHDATARAIVTGDINTINMPRVHWKPYQATSFSRTPIMNLQPHHVPQITYAPSGPEDHEKSAEIVKVPQAQYPFDEGVYLLQDYTPLPLGVDRQIEDKTAQQDMPHNFLLELLNWWKELFAISVLTVLVSVMVHIVLLKYVQAKPTAVESSSSKTQDVGTEVDKTIEVYNPGTEIQPYVSRYYTDFDQLAVLGHGGFGVVFQCKNKLDDCMYATKRIALHNSERAKEKVMREVKALAKLDHSGIVRYHQAWFESPPPGWQEEKDRITSDMPSSSPGFSATELSPAPTPVAEAEPIRRLSQLYLSHESRENIASYPKHDAFNPLKPFDEETISVDVKGYTDDGDESWDVLEDSGNARRAGSSSGFTPKAASFSFGGNSESGSESGSFSFSNSPPKKWANDDSFEISFRDENCDYSENSQVSNALNELPFSAYKIDSSNSKYDNTVDQTTSASVEVVFEDSGCGDQPNCNSPGHMDHVIDISSTTSQSQSRSRRLRTKSVSPVQTPVLSTTSKHRKTSSLDLTHSTASRPIDLPIKKKDSETSTTPVPKLYLYIQMQLCKRESLKDWLATVNSREKLLLLDIFHQITSAMDYVHDIGLMHRDLKPSNIFFSMDGLVKIGDFGLVTALEEKCEDEREISPIYAQRRHTGKVGTKLYMSPEQMSGKNYTQKVDIYSMGLIFFELFHMFDTQMERIRTLMDVKRLKFPDSFIKMFSQLEIQFVKRLLSHNPDQRPSTKEILSQKMLSQFEEIHRAYISARARSSSRIRTYSTSSNHSGSGTGSHSSPDLEPPYSPDSGLDVPSSPASDGLVQFY